MSGTRNVRLIGAESSTKNVILVGRKVISNGSNNSVIITEDLEPRIDRPLIGLKNGINHIYQIENSEKWYQSSIITIEVKWNGRILTQGNDYTIHESGGIGTGYNEIRLTPWQGIGFLPRAVLGNRPEDSLVATYWVKV